MRYKIMGIVFNFLAYIPLGFGMYSGRLAGEEGGNIVVRGFNLVEFSPWGSLLVILPIVLFAITYLKIENRFKNVMLILFYMLNTICVYNATAAADQWVRATIKGFVYFKPYVLFYLSSMFIATVFLFIHNNRYPDYREF